MRVNIYNEDLTSRIEVVHKTAESGILFYGLRFYLHDEMDDASAVTFWFRSMSGLVDTFRLAYDVSVITFLHPKIEPEGK